MYKYNYVCDQTCTQNFFKFVFQHYLLGESIHTLETQVVSTLSEMKSLFPNNKPADGLGIHKYTSQYFT